MILRYLSSILIVSNVTLVACANICAQSPLDNEKAYFSYTEEINRAKSAHNKLRANGHGDLTNKRHLGRPVTEVISDINNAAVRASIANPQKAMPYIYLGIASASLGFDNSALEHFSSAIEKEPGSSDAHKWRGYFHGSRNRWQQAEFDLQRAAQLDKDPKGSGTYDYLKYVRAQLSNYRTEPKRQQQQEYDTTKGFPPIGSSTQSIQQILDAGVREAYKQNARKDSKSARADQRALSATKRDARSVAEKWYQVYLEEKRKYEDAKAEMLRERNSDFYEMAKKAADTAKNKMDEAWANYKKAKSVATNVTNALDTSKKRLREIEAQGRSGGGDVYNGQRTRKYQPPTGHKSN